MLSDAENSLILTRLTPVATLFPAVYYTLIGKPVSRRHRQSGLLVRKLDKNYMIGRAPLKAWIMRTFISYSAMLVILSEIACFKDDFQLPAVCRRPTLLFKQYSLRLSSDISLKCILFKILKRLIYTSLHSYQAHLSKYANAVNLTVMRIDGMCWWKLAISGGDFFQRHSDSSRIPTDPEIEAHWHSTTKTLSMVFHLHHKEAKHECQQHVNDKTLPFCSEPKYIGVALDRTLRSMQNFETHRRQLTSRVAFLRWLAGIGWGVGAATLHTATLTLGLVHSAPEYCAPAWWRTAHTRLH